MGGTISKLLEAYEKGKISVPSPKNPPVPPESFSENPLCDVPEPSEWRPYKNVGL